MKNLTSGIGSYITLHQTRGSTLLQKRTMTMGSTGCIAYFTMQQLLEHWNPLLETHLKHQFGVDILKEWDSILQDTVSVMD